MSDKKQNNNSQINKISLNFVDCKINEDVEKQNLTSEKKIFYSKIIKTKNKPVKSKTNDYNKKLKQNDKNIMKNLSKDNISSKIKNSNFKITDKKNSEKNNENELSYKKILYTERSKYSTASNFFPKSTIHTEDNSSGNTKKSFYIINNNYDFKNSSTYEIYKAKQESLKEKKLYEEKFKILVKHVNVLKKQEQELYKKVQLNKEKEKKINIKKKEKENKKRALLSAEIDKRNALEEKKRTTMMQKLKTNIGLKNSQEKITKEKINNYKQAISNKKKAKEKRIENNNKKEKYNHIQIEKIKNELEKIKEKNLRKRNENINKLNNSYRISYQNNLNETKKLKDKILKLELIEGECLENLKKTQEYIKMTNDENNIANNYRIVNSLYEKDFDKNNKRNAISMKRRNLDLNVNNDIKDKNASSQKIKFE